jgi:hypothetical protein
MKLCRVLLFGILSTTAGAGDLNLPAQRTAVLCFENIRDRLVLRQANELAKKIYAGIGVELRWSLKPSSCPVDAIVVSLREDTPRNLLPGALGYSTPYEGVHVEIFYDRILEKAEPRAISTLLAHVLVHESTHILQGTAQHSQTGMMKAHWDLHDFFQMLWKPLPFTPEDVTLIYLGMDKRAERIISSRR